MTDEEFLSSFPLVKRHPFLPHVFSYEKGDYEFGKRALYDLGAYSIQDAAAMLPAFVLNPQEGETVLDLCAAPGGKTIFMSLLCAQKALVIANDLSFPRAKDLSSNVERMGLGNAVVVNDDFSKIRAPKEGAFDAIMLDAPCSGTAMFRKSSQAEGEWSPNKMGRCLSLQLSLLEQAYLFLKPGGRMVYSTCSFCFEEDEGALLSFLSRHGDMKPVELEEREGYFHGEALKEAVYLFPHRFQGEGQFFCLLKKEGAPSFRPAKKQEISRQCDDFISFYGLGERFNFRQGDAFWSLPFPSPDLPLHVLRNGVKVSSFPFEEPDFALAHFLSSSGGLELSEKEALSYLKGETLPLRLPDGFYLASCRSMGLGFFKMAKGKMKNKYPKGLRRFYRVF